MNYKRRNEVRNMTITLVGSSTDDADDNKEE
jgi:hypothetical protein